MKCFKLLCLLFCLLPITVVHAQMHDNIWLFGSGGGNQTPMTDSFGMTMLDFSNFNSPQVIEKQQYPANFVATNAVICDSTGNLLFYTNGEAVYSHNHQIMSNGGGISAGNNGGGLGLRLAQGAVAIPYPGHIDQFILLTIEEFNSFPFGWNLFYHIIDMNENNGLGSVIKKRELIVQDTMTRGHIAVTKHANGRDWWFVVQRRDDNKYYTGLVSPSGIDVELQAVGDVVLTGLGQAIFTPDGTKYIHTNDHRLSTPNQIVILDFDRCSGTLSNYRTRFLPNPSTFGIGGAVSSNSKNFYALNTTEALLYDLNAQDVFNSETLIEVWDSSYYFFWPKNFLLGQLAPDGRIYVNSNNGGNTLHYINFPNRVGFESQFVQNGVPTPTIILYEMPNLPNYRLGPLDNSSCDTLGLDNHPLARWRWEQEDTLLPLQITFTDLSDYEPTNWYWTFGDGISSTEQNPIHTYSLPKVYDVCLVVQNDNSSDTLCRVVNLGVSSQNSLIVEKTIEIRPNPFSDRVVVNLPEERQQVVLNLYDFAGRLINSYSLKQGYNTLNTTGFASGFYFWSLYENNVFKQSGKLIKK